MSNFVLEINYFFFHKNLMHRLIVVSETPCSREGKNIFLSHDTCKQLTPIGCCFLSLETVDTVVMIDNEPVSGHGQRGQLILT
jgi:hypothetical protein